VTNKYTKLLISTLEADGHSTTVFLRRQSYTTTSSRHGSARSLGDNVMM